MGLGGQVDVSTCSSSKEECGVFKAGDDLSSKQEDNSLEAEAKRFKSFHEVKGREVKNQNQWIRKNLQKKP